MTQISHRPCLYCDSSNAFSYNTESGLFTCFSCGVNSGSVRSKTYDGESTIPFEESNYGKEEGLSLEPYVPDEYRSITKSTMEKCGVYFTENEGKETAHYTYTNSTKHRELPKTIRCSGSMDSFWGQDDYPDGGKILTITEGEEDRMSVIEMMGDFPCVSVPGATPSRAFWDNARKFLKGWDKVFLDTVSSL